MKNHKWLRRLGIGVAILVIGFFSGYLILVRPNPFYNPDKIPQLVTSNFVDLDRIFMISKFRSGVGHDYSSDGETCRSMKHYFNVGHNVDSQGKPIRSFPTVTEPNINIYAPFDGFVWTSSPEKGSVGTQVQFVSRVNPFYDVRFFHIDLKPGLHFGSYVRTGQMIGTMGPKDGMDVAFESSSDGPGGHNASVFLAMTDGAFKPYADLGFKREDFIITREARDAEPLQCDPGAQFKYSSNQDDSTSKGAIYSRDISNLRPDPYADQNRGPNPPPIHYGPPR